MTELCKKMSRGEEKGEQSRLGMAGPQGVTYLVSCTAGLSTHGKSPGRDFWTSWSLQGLSWMGHKAPPAPRLGEVCVHQEVKNPQVQLAK